MDGSRRCLQAAPCVGGAREAVSARWSWRDGGATAIMPWTGGASWVQQRGLNPSQVEEGIALCRRAGGSERRARASSQRARRTHGTHHHTSTRAQTPARRLRQRRNSRLPQAALPTCDGQLLQATPRRRLQSLAAFPGPPAAQRAPQIPSAVSLGVCLAASENRPLAFRPTSLQVIVCGLPPGPHAV